MRSRNLVLLLMLASSCGGPPPPQGDARPAVPPAAPPSRLTRPEELGTLEDPDRDEWQQPQRVMDALGVADGSHVADLGAGGGWFTIRLARRVGPNGVVYAQDIQREMLASIEKRAFVEGLGNVRPVLGTPSDSHLPKNLQAILLVDTYPQLSDPLRVLRDAAAALAPTGRFGIIDFKKNGDGGPGPPIDQRTEPDTIVKQAAQAGLVLQSQETFLRYQYLLVFTKAPAK